MFEWRNLVAHRQGHIGGRGSCPLEAGEWNSCAAALCPSPPPGFLMKSPSQGLLMSRGTGGGPAPRSTQTPSITSKPPSRSCPQRGSMSYSDTTPRGKALLHSEDLLQVRVWPRARFQVEF